MQARQRFVQGGAGGRPDGDQQRGQRQDLGQAADAGAAGFGRFGRRRHVDGIEGAGILAKLALDAAAGSDRRMPFAQPRQPVEQDAVGTAEPAVGPGDHDAEQQDQATQRQHQEPAILAEDGDKGIVFADQEAAAQGDREHGQAKIGVGQDAEDAFNGLGHLHRPHGDHLLDGAERADGGAEDPPEEQGEEQGQGKEDQDDQRHPEVAVAESGDHVLQRADRADAAMAPEAKVAQREQRQQEDPAPRPPAQDQPGRQREDRQQQPGIQPEGKVGRHRRLDRRMVVVGGEFRHRETGFGQDRQCGQEAGGQDGKAEAHIRRSSARSWS